MVLKVEGYGNILDYQEEMNNYITDLEEFQLSSDAARKLSLSLKSNCLSRRESLALILFNKLTITTVSILRTLPKSQYYCNINNKEYWDLSTLASLTRTIIENYNNFYYIAVEDVSDDEREFRIIIWDLYSKVKRKECLELINSKNIKVLDRLEKDINYIKSNLDKNPYAIKFKQDNPKKYKNLRKGKKAVGLTNKEISKKAGIHPEFYKSVFNYLSSHIHTYSLSTDQLDVFNVNNPNSINVMYTILNHCTGYIFLGIRGFIKVFPHLKDSISEQVRNMIVKYEVIFRQENLRE